MPICTVILVAVIWPSSLEYTAKFTDDVTGAQP